MPEGAVPCSTLTPEALGSRAWRLALGDVPDSLTSLRLVQEMRCIRDLSPPLRTRYLCISSARLLPVGLDSGR